MRLRHSGTQLALEQQNDELKKCIYLQCEDCYPKGAIDKFHASFEVFIIRNVRTVIINRMLVADFMISPNKQNVRT